ncbi:MAG: type II secretion system major pseudopilin GspG [Phycisphaeraceae bacterium]
MVRRVAKSGFTLIEVLLVLVIILMLAGAMVVFVLPQSEGAERDTTQLKLDQIETALQTFRLQVGQYPTEDMGGLDALGEQPEFENERLGDRWRGPYVSRGTEFTDAWGYDLVYEPQDAALSDEENAEPYRLFSVGPDGQQETDDDVFPSGHQSDEEEAL